MGNREYIETIRGRGRLTGSEGVPVHRVNYAIDVYEEQVGSAPPLRLAVGTLTGISGTDLAHAMRVGRILDLELQDGRHAAVRLRNTNGDFDVDGEIK
jgi:hypothetical protein